MALKKLSLRAKPEHTHLRLDQYLAQELPKHFNEPVSKGRVRKLIMAGAVYLNGKRIRIASKELLNGAHVDLYIDPVKFNSNPVTRQKDFSIGAAQVLYEDADLIAFNKPAGLPTQPTLDEARACLFNLAKKFLCSRDSNPNFYLGLHPRLDRDTSGIVLFTKTQRVNADTAELFSKHLAQKTYWAIVEMGSLAKLRDHWTVKNFLGQVSKKGKKAKFGAVKSGGLVAQTEFRPIEQLSTQTAWIEATPKTGRTHQIRVHLSEQGMPICGDDFYGAKLVNAPRVMLHAAKLTFPHPVTKMEISIDCPTPEDFKKCLADLRQSPSEGGEGS